MTLRSIRVNLARWLWPQITEVCATCRSPRTAAWLEALEPIAPRTVSRSSELIVHTATIYDDLRKQEGWRDFWGRAEAARDQIEQQLLQGRFGMRQNGVTDDELRAMLFVLNLLISIPRSAEEGFERWRAELAERNKLQGKLDERLQ